MNWPRDCVKCFTGIISYNPYRTPARQGESSPGSNTRIVLRCLAQSHKASERKKGFGPASVFRQSLLSVSLIPLLIVNEGSLLISHLETLGNKWEREPDLKEQTMLKAIMNSLFLIKNKSAMLGPKCLLKLSKEMGKCSYDWTSPCSQ